MRFEKAEEFLAAARLCQMSGYANSSVSRSYYAAFQAGIVALSAAGVLSGEDGWSHAGLHAAFARELIHRRKLYPANFAHYLLDLITWRLGADYESVDITARKAARSSVTVQRVRDEGEGGNRVMKRSERYYQAFADLISQVKERCPDGRVVISEHPYEDEDGHIHVYPPDSWDLDQCMELSEQMGAVCSDRFLEGGPLILVMVVEPADKVAQDKADFLAKRGYWQKQAS